MVASSKDMRIQALMDVEADMPLAGIDAAIELLEGALRRAAKRSNGASVIARAETYIRCWAEELEE